MRGVVRGLFVTALYLIAASVIASAGAREWVDTTGSFRVEAELADVTETHVRLTTAAGKTLTVSIARLCEVDRQYLKWKQLEKSVSPEDKLAAKKLVEQAMVLFDVDPRGNAAQIDRKLREAGKLNPADIRAEFLCGVFNLVVSADPDKAERNFTTCLARKPGDVGVLSNLALSQVKGGNRRGRPGQACPTCGGLGLDREVVLHLAEFKSRFSGSFEDEDEDEEEMEDDTEFGDSDDEDENVEDSFLQPYDGPHIDQGRSVPKIVHAPSSGGFAEGRFELGGGIEYVEAAGRALNLISLVDRRDFRPAEKWRVADGKLVCVAGNLVPKVVFPINVPEEYDLQVVVTQHAMRNGVGLIVPNGHGQSLAWMIGGTGGSETSISMGEKYPRLAAGDRMFKEEVPYDCVLCVRRERLEGYINGKRVFCYHGNRKPLVTNIWHRSPDHDRIAVSCDDPATFHMVRCVEIK